MCWRNVLVVLFASASTAKSSAYWGKCTPCAAASNTSVNVMVSVTPKVAATHAVECSYVSLGACAELRTSGVEIEVCISGGITVDAVAERGTSPVNAAFFASCGPHNATELRVTVRITCASLLRASATSTTSTTSTHIEQCVSGECVQSASTRVVVTSCSGSADVDEDVGVDGSFIYFLAPCYTAAEAWYPKVDIPSTPGRVRGRVRGRMQGIGPALALVGAAALAARVWLWRAP